MTVKQVLQNIGKKVIVAEHETMHTRWVGTSGTDFTAHHNEYTGIIRNSFVDDDSVEVQRISKDGHLTESYEYVNASILTLAK